MARKSGASLAEAASSEIKKDFNLDSFKNKKGLESSTKFKEQKWIPISDALKDALSIPGIPVGHITIARGGSDTGKTTLLIETATQGQSMGLLPVFIITEMKWDFQHAKKMGFQVEEVVDKETGELLNYKGFFIYVDRSTLHTIEDVAAFIIDLLDEQKKGNLPYDLLFLWDSVGSMPCQLSVDQGKNNPMWNAGAMATQFGNFVNQKFPLSRKENYPYTNTFFIINKTGVQPALRPMEQPKRTNKGGDTMYWYASLVFTFGNVTNSGTSKIQAVKNKKNVEFAKRTKIAIDKIHIGEGIATKSTVIVTPHGFIPDTPYAITDYKKQHSSEWFTDNPGEIEIVEDTSEWEESQNLSITDISDTETEQ
jgi:hypothetical protein